MALKMTFSYRILWQDNKEFLRISRWTLTVSGVRRGGGRGDCGLEQQVWEGGEGSTSGPNK